MSNKKVISKWLILLLVFLISPSLMAMGDQCAESPVILVGIVVHNDGPAVCGPNGTLEQPRHWHIVTTTYSVSWDVDSERCVTTTVVDESPPYPMPVAYTQNSPECSNTCVAFNVTFGGLGEDTAACTFQVDKGNGFEPILAADQSQVFVKQAEQHDVTYFDGEVQQWKTIPMLGLCSLDLYTNDWPLDVKAYKAFNAGTGEQVGQIVKGGWENDRWYPVELP